MIASQNSLVNSLIPATRISPLTRDILLLVAGVLLLAISAQFKVALWPVPITMQTLVVMLIGGLYGWRLGGLTVLMYVLDGMLVSSFVPWFAGPGSFLYPFVAPTAGYLWGFVLAAAFVGFCAERFDLRGNFISMFGAMMIGNLIITVAGLAFAYFVFFSGNREFAELWAGWAAPFIIGDTMKAVMAAGLIAAGGSWLARLRG